MKGWMICKIILFGFVKMKMNLKILSNMILWILNYMYIISWTTEFMTNIGYSIRIFSRFVFHYKYLFWENSSIFLHFIIKFIKKYNQCIMKSLRFIPQKILLKFAPFTSHQMITFTEKYNEDPVFTVLQMK